MRLTRRYRFSASHRLHSPQLSEEANDEIYGKCNNPFGHGHDYVLEVSVRGAVDERTGLVVNLVDLDGLVQHRVLNDFHLRNMNTQIPAFTDSVPTTENVAVEIRSRLARNWEDAFPGGLPQLEKIRLFETRKNIIEVVG
jgi:6-pyruvoyltetrahydropterin/6-carboxytetrahydropterin synthase